MRTLSYLRLIVILLIILGMAATPASADVGPAAPPMPTNVTASQGSQVNKIRVSWPASAGATYYKIHRGIWNPNAPINWPNTYYEYTNTYYEDTSAIQGYKYDYRIEACASAGNCSPWSYPAATGWPGLATPTNVQATDGTYDDHICVTWNQVSGATNYKLFIGTSSAGYFHWMYAPGYGTIPLCEYNREPGVLYYYWVQACNDLDCSGTSTSDTGYQTLLPPTNVESSDGEYTDRVRTTWELSSGATSYWTYYSTSANGAKSLFCQSLSDDCSHWSPPSYNRYWYWVRACKGEFCDSCYRCSDFGAPDTGFRRLSPTTGIQASDGAYPDKVRITWNASDGATNYRVYRADSPSGDKTLLTTYPSVTTLDDTSVPNLTTYYYWARPCNDLGCGDHGDSDSGYRAEPTATRTATSTPTATDVPNTPTRTKTPTPTDAPGTPTRTKTSTPTDAPFTPTRTRTLTPTNVPLTPTPTGTDIPSTPTPTSTDTPGRPTRTPTNTRIPPPLPPKGVQATDGTYKDKVQVAWEAVRGATSYRVARAFSPWYPQTEIVATRNTTYDDKGAWDGITYVYWVRACSQNGCGPFSVHDRGYRGSGVASAQRSYLPMILQERREKR